MAISENLSSKSGYFGGLFFPEKWENLEWLYLYTYPKPGEDAKIQNEMTITS